MTTTDSPTGDPTRSERPRRRRPWWLWLILILLLLVALAFGLSQCAFSGSGPAGQAPSPQPPAAPPAAAPPGAGAPGPGQPGTPPQPGASTPPSTGAGSAPGGGAGTLTADGVALLPLPPASGPGGPLGPALNKTATGRDVTVLSVPADEGFWIGTDATNRVWLQLLGDGESPYTVRPGDRVTFTGTVQAHDQRFAETVGVSTTDGADQLTRQGAHLAVARNDLDGAS